MASAKGPGAGLENLLYWGGDETSIRGDEGRADYASYQRTIYSTMHKLISYCGCQKGKS